MNCAGFDESAELYVLGELAAPQLAEAEEHVAQCAVCRASAEAARLRLRALEAVLAPHRVSEGFAERALARVRAEAAPAEPEPQAEGPEPVRSRIFRYAALAAAAVLLALAGYGFLRRSSGAWLEHGAAALVGPSPRALRPREPLAPGQELMTAANGSATLALDGGRLRVALAPMSRARILDPRSGTALQLLRGEAYCRGSGGGDPPLVASPLASVAPGQGIVSLHVAPEPGSREPAAAGQPSHGTVIVAAHGGAARVIMPGHPGPPVPLERGQVLTLSSDRPRGLWVPVPIERLRQSLQAEARAAAARHGELELRWHALMRGLAEGGDHFPLSRLAGELQEALSQTQSLREELTRRMAVLDRWESEGRRAFPVLLQPQAVPR